MTKSPVERPLVIEEGVDWGVWVQAHHYLEYALRTAVLEKMIVD
jgi:hypothetical protein